MSRRRADSISVDGSLCRSIAADDRGVSNVVGYVLVFSLITLTIGTVFAVGITGVEDRQEAERVANVERAFDVLDDNLRDIQRYEDPSRSTEIRLSDGALSLSETTRVQLRNESGGVLLNRTSHTLAYTHDDTTIAYETGAWFRSDGDAAVMRSEPRFVADNGRTTLPLVLLYPDGDSRVSGGGTIQVAAGGLRSNTGPNRSAAAGETLELRIESDYADGWKRYFERTDGFDLNETASTDGEAVAELTETETVYVHRIALDVALRR